MLTWEKIPHSPCVYIFMFWGTLGMRLVNTQLCAENLIPPTFISWGSIECVVLSMEELPESTKSLTTLRWRHLSLHWGQVFWWASHWVRLRGRGAWWIWVTATVLVSPDLILFMCMPHLPVHPSAADESWYWPKWLLCSGWFCVTSYCLPFVREMWFIDYSCYFSLCWRISSCCAMGGRNLYETLPSTSPHFFPLWKWTGNNRASNSGCQF